jgi:hypothetical protein
MKKLFLSFLISLVVLANLNIVFAQDFEIVIKIVTVDPPGGIEGAALGILIWIAIWMIIYGFLTVLRIFGRMRTGFNIGLSFVISLISISIPIKDEYFVPTVGKYIFESIGLWSIAIFAVIYIVGSFLYAKKRGAIWSSQASIAAGYDDVVKGLRRDLAEKREKMMELTNRVASTARADTRAGLENQITKLKDEIKSIEDRLEEMRHTIKSA